MSENVEIPSFLVGYQVYQEGRMLILSRHVTDRRIVASLSRRKDANSQLIARSRIGVAKSIKKEGC